jgi:hypothetical protein
MNDRRIKDERRRESRTPPPHQDNDLAEESGSPKIPDSVSIEEPFDCISLSREDKIMPPVK